MKSTRQGFIATLIIISIVIVGFIGADVVNSTNDRLSSNVSRLEEDYNALQEKYYALLGNYSDLESRYKNILLQRPSMSTPSGSSSDNSDAQQYLSRYSALQQLYSELQSEYYQYQSDYRKLKEMIDARLMQSSLIQFITPEDPAVMNITLEVAGELGRSPDSGLSWSGINAIYDWVNNNIEYKDDGLYPQLPTDVAEAKVNGLKHTAQMAQYPNETLRMRTGDCEDLAVLLVSMVRAYMSIQVECIWITGANAGHVAVAVPIGEDKVVIMDPIRDYYSHDVLGEMAVNSISTEIYDWLNIWRPTLGNDVHVYRVFSDYMDKYFESTQEYLIWQANR